MDSVILALIIILIVTFIVTIIVILFRRKKVWPITMIRDSEDQPLYAIFQSANSFIIKNMKIDKFENAKFKEWSDVVSFIEKDKSFWQ